MKTTHKTIKTMTTIALNRKDVLDAVRQLHPEIPAHAEISVRVPGGADWSNVKLEIDIDTPLEIEYTVTTTEEE